MRLNHAVMKEDHHGKLSKSLIRFHLIVSGRVQGVGYRYFCDRKAADFGLTGWVRNEPNGTVEIEVQGTQTQVESFIITIQKGPTLGHVSAVHRNEIPVCPDDSSFIIEY